MNNDIWYGESKIAFTPDNWKINVSEVKGHFLTTDISTIKKEKLSLTRDFIEKHFTGEDKEFFMQYV